MPYDTDGNWIDPDDPYGGTMPPPNPMGIGSTSARMPPPVRMDTGGAVIPTDDPYANPYGILGLPVNGAPPVPYKTPPEVDDYQTANKAVQDQMAKNAAMPAWQKVARGVGGAAIEFLGHHRAPDASAQLASALQNPGMQGRLAQLGLKKQAADEARQNAQLEATTGLKNAIYGATAQNRAGMQENRLQTAGAEPVTSMPPPTPPPSVGMPATVTSGNVPPLRPGAMPPPQPPTVTGGQNDVSPALGSAMQANSAPPMTNRIGNYGQTFDPVAALQGKQVPLQVPTLGDKAKTDVMSPEMAKALGRPQDAGQHVEPAIMRQYEAELERRRAAALAVENKPDPNATAATLAVKAAGGDKEAAKALELLKPPKEPNPNAVTAGERSYNKATQQLNVMSKPVSDAQMRMGRLQDTLAKGSPQADALVAPELLTVMAGGQGSGLRMNEAEIARIVGGRSVWENLKANIQHWSTNPETANSITPAQRAQIRALVQTVAEKLNQKQALINDTYDAITNSDDPQVHHKALNTVRQKFAEIDRGSGTSETATHPPADYKMTATNPQGHKIGSNDGGNTWFDVATGKAVQ